MSAVADEEAARHRHAPPFPRGGFHEQRGRVDHQAVPDHCQFAGSQDAARNELQHELLLADKYRMARVMAALISSDDIEPFREQVDDLTLALVSPLGAQDDDVSHFVQTRPFYG